MISRNVMDNADTSSFDSWPARRPVKNFHKRLKENHGMHKQVEKFLSEHEAYDEQFSKVLTFEKGIIFYYFVYYE